MSEEIKDNEVKKEAEKETKAEETPKAEAVKPAEPTPEKVAVSAPEAKPAEQKEKERPTNCAACNKAFKHKLWHYRNGKYFCNKRCWEKFDAEIKAKAAEAKAKEAGTQEPAAGPENPSA
ncbi:MAG: hypothetical protein KKD29_05995 [Candidatus Omnitrophica bacterium]|nr:hypothetical protein [Candidatus Omnitrophota bacterium]MBU4488890.1 hypothetical protein [Candidatus Omnitrophota bacterium]MCG2705478.1 hypothetical protein [Candidatus Omnitrophota bacterium]